jgi:hypothetical protein
MPLNLIAAASSVVRRWYLYLLKHTYLKKIHVGKSEVLKESCGEPFAQYTRAVLFSSV